MTKVHASRQSAREKPALASVAVLVAPFENDVLDALVAEAYEERSEAWPARGLLATAGLDGRHDDDDGWLELLEQPECLTTPSGLFIGHVKPALPGSNCRRADRASAPDCAGGTMTAARR